jgi:multiple sugar transport system permease protein
MNTVQHSKLSYSLIVLSFLLPSLVGFVAFILMPTIATVGLSFTDYRGGGDFSFIGLQNYIDAFRSESFINSLWVTIRFVAVSVILQLGIAMAFALMLNGDRKGKNFFRGLFFIPVVLSNIAVSMGFSLLFDVRRGPINQFLSTVGLDPLPFLTSPDTALGTIIFVMVWQQFGYFMVIFLAGLQTISPSLYENADLDGAGFLQKLTRITLPMLSPTTFFAVVVAIIRGFQVFDQVYILTGGQWGGGPQGSTSVLVFRIYQDAFTHFRMGYAAAQSTVLLLFVLVITVFQYVRQSRWVNYDVT